MGSSEEYGQEKSDPSSLPEQHVLASDDIDHGAESELQRRLSSRHITMIALGSSIGMGLWLGSGTSLINGGPAALLIGCKCFAAPIVPSGCVAAIEVAGTRKRLTKAHI
jgi:amino acid permease